ncbi:VWA domain-containing protein [Trinickia fusca]|uniref:VWA domain-containing protein n=1 Tax=Trinickia fusca TaxID=2419777 RepID=A0A494XIW9_9BURK|nr:VWA domain-containing protein [Trinickia fusca]RKP50528.1 VWA domain-containing protein [Trinickia fusca]
MFQIQGFFNPYLPAGETRLDAVLTVTSDTKAVSTSTNRKVVGFVLDVSGSMRGEKLTQAKLAARRGIDMLPEDVWFFVVAFSGTATVVVRACPATAANRERAHHSIQNLDAGGSTAMSRGLEFALREVQSSGAEIASVYFETDGDNNPDDNELLPQVLADCKGVFQAECRGIGTDWKPEQLRRIASALLGTADAIPDPAGLERDFQAFLARSLSKGIANATLKLWSPKVVKVTTVKQMSPEIADLLPLAVHVDDKTIHVPLGSWGAETRDYQVAFQLPAGAIGDEILACRAAVVYQDGSDEIKVDCGPIAVAWSEDAALTTRIVKEVAHYNGQSELAASIQEGLEAKAQGDEDLATRLLGRAAQIAAQSGNEEVTRRLKKVVDVVDATAGTVRLKRADKGAEMELELGGTRTVRRSSGAAPVAGEHA